MEEHFAFVDHDNNEHTEGRIDFIFYEDHGNGAIETLGEPVLDSIQDLKAIFDYIKSQFPKGWEIKNGKVVPFNA